MSSIDPFSKRVVRGGWRFLQSLNAIFAIKKLSGLAVWYGGARSGDLGGPLVKVKRLQRYFPEQMLGFSLVYLLSNTPYLSPFALRILKMRSIPIVLNQNGVFYAGWFDGDWRKKNREMSHAWHAADVVLCQSKFCLDCAERFLGPRSGKTEILFNAVDLNHFKPRKEISIKSCSGGTTFLLSGKIDDHLYYRVEATIKGVAVARERGCDISLKIAGWMSPLVKSRTETLAEDLRLSDLIEISGPYTQENAPDIYRSADIYVMIKHNDPCPNTVIEALACGVPVLYADSGGVPELATGLSGVAVAVLQGFDANYVPDSHAIADGMEKIMEDLPIRKLASRARAEEAFDQDAWIQRHKNIFEELIEGRKK